MAEEEQEQKQDLIKAAKQLPPMETFSLKPRTFDEAFRFANLIAESDLVPKEFQKKPANVLVAVQLGMELGVSPMQALQSMYVVNGRPSIFGDLLPAIVFASGLCEQFDEEGDETTATCTVKRRGFKAISRTFTWEDAKRAKGYEHGQMIPLADKQTYKSFPKRMLQMRSRAWALRDAFPDVLKGVAVYEEVQDEQPSIEIEKQPPISLPQPKQSGTVADFKARQAAKVAPEIGGDLSNKVDPEHRKLADAMDKLRREQEGKEDGERTKPVVDEVVPSKAGDGLRQGSERRDTAREDAQGTDARQEPPADGQNEPAKEQGAQKAWSEPEKLSLKEQIFAWIKNATTEELESRDAKVCYIREIFNNKKLLEKLTVDERTEVLQAYDKERRARP